MNVLVVQRKHSSSWSSMVAGLTMLAIGAVLWLDLAGVPATTSPVCSFSSCM